MQSQGDALRHGALSRPIPGVAFGSARLPRLVRGAPMGGGTVPRGLRERRRGALRLAGWWAPQREARGSLATGSRAPGRALAGCGKTRGRRRGGWQGAEVGRAEGRGEGQGDRGGSLGGSGRWQRAGGRRGTFCGSAPHFASVSVAVSGFVPASAAASVDAGGEKLPVEGASVDAVAGRHPRGSRAVSGARPCLAGAAQRGSS